MEDAMVINKGSYERGLAGACIYKSEILDLALLSKQSTSRSQLFSRRKQPTAEHYFDSIVEGSDRVHKDSSCFESTNLF
ncbi:unnamed protein product [Echinostoma caproni]|uniref:DNA-directed RNA polymerase n=1 Tax=Echinostoma caproni TaxID=27848 RepID=A0A183A239_9TREM|nr:unnamed protein product [Echinostoma caproni]